VLCMALTTANTFATVTGAACLGIGVLLVVGGPLVEWRLKRLMERASKAEDANSQ
jgi:hypothetical protein